MCKCDAGCCSVFYPIWCIVWGAIDLIFGSIIAYSNQNTDDTNADIERVVKVYYYIKIVISVFYITAGICMMLGIKKNIKVLFDVGKVLSYFYPIMACFFIFPIVVHIIAIKNLIDYKKNRWGE
ncbi:uncharacterized protein Dyak_GE28765, isoform B [Drosophila yakuba]|uniref:Uncharacterized protein, isoform A n=1 Tax=Drosophila yakuba TaxID=7245 RepID=A0A0R1DT32_DROYA|nr:uncharacterized protein Dyak_GE28765, isoform A [Drosophila yakuba]KRJ99677.1 uncharacterized protein Dyak_GE28765, isoform B [Drosophila yakuba]